MPSPFEALVPLFAGASPPPERLGKFAGEVDLFEALDDVHAALDRLSQRNPPLVAVLPRQPGTKESRYMHLFAGEPEKAESASPVHSSETGGDTKSSADRLTNLESEVLELRREVSEIREQLAAFRRQFE